MRFYRSAKIMLSKDEVTYPKQIRFSEEVEETDVTLLKESTTGVQVIPKATTDYQLPMGQVSAGKYLYMRADKDFSLKIDSGSALVMAANKPNELWLSFASLKVTTGLTDPVELTWVIAGE